MLMGRVPQSSRVQKFSAGDHSGPAMKLVIIQQSSTDRALRRCLIRPHGHLASDIL